MPYRLHLDVRFILVLLGQLLAHDTLAFVRFPPVTRTVTTTTHSPYPWSRQEVSQNPSSQASAGLNRQLLSRGSNRNLNQMSDPRKVSVPTDEDNGDHELLLERVLQVAVKASKRAGDIILGNAGGSEVTDRKANSRDLLTLIDPLCEQAIRETVLQTFPDHDFLGEEDVAPGKDASAAALQSKLDGAKSDWLWVVDPIDGTSNFVHGMPLCMPSVAATFEGEVVVGVIFDCHRNELFTAVKGQGAFLNGEPITVGPQEVIGDAIVAMGSPRT